MYMSASMDALKMEMPTNMAFKLLHNYFHNPTKLECMHAIAKNIATSIYVLLIEVCLV
jgi:hypothetical protein